ncbi:MAG: TerC family protein [Phycisphaerales bacterium]
MFESLLTLEGLFTTENMLALLTLAALEIVLGIDNIVFITILTGKLPEQHQARARTIGLGLGMLMRVILLFAISWIIKLEENELFTVFGHSVTAKDLIMLAGGLFLIGKATFEIHEKIEGPGEEAIAKDAATQSVGKALAQIALLDLVFSLDSVITAVGMADDIRVMVIAVILAVIVMMVFAGPVGDFVQKRPTIKMLALSFLLLIGFVLVAEGLHVHIPKGYIYFAMAFSLMVEILNLKVIDHMIRKKGVGKKTSI